MARSKLAWLFLENVRRAAAVLHFIPDSRSLDDIVFVLPTLFAASLGDGKFGKLLAPPW